MVAWTDYFVGNIAGSKVVVSESGRPFVSHEIAPRDYVEIELTETSNELPFKISFRSFDSLGTQTEHRMYAQAGTTYAAGLCDAYTGGGFTDWYLPSIWELNLCNQAAFVVNTVLPTGVFDSSYWSSTDYSSAGFAYAQLFNLSSGDDVAKNVVLRVRAVRRF